MRDPDYEDLVGRKGIWDWIPTVIAFLAIYAVLFVFYTPNLLFSLTTTAGGDTGAYHYPMQVLIQDLLPHFKLTGWAPGWYAGMPMFTFYFPFPFLVIAALQWIIPYQIAFKLVTVLGVFLLPLFAYSFARLLRIRRPYPVLAAVFALLFLFLQSYTIYGGNVLSTLAGEFSYMLSFALCFLFLGTMSKGMERGAKFDWLFLINCLLVLVIVLSHIVTTFVLVFLVWGLLLVHWRRRALVYLLSVGAVGFALTAFWSVPFLVDLKWSAKMAWTQLHSIHALLPTAVLPVAGLALVGMAYALARKDRRVLLLAWITFVSLVLIYVLPNGRLWNARVMPFFWFSLYLWAAYATLWLIRPFSVVIVDLFHVKEVTAKRVYVPLVAVALGAVVILTSNTAAAWITWNYTGYQGKATYSQYQQINNFIASLPPGRVMVEHSSTINDFGTERAFELIPYWTELDAENGNGIAQPTMEGTLMEASFTAPFHFINQAELSEEPSDAISGISYPSLDISNGLTHLQLMNIPYLLTVSSQVTSAVKADPRATLLGTFGDYNVFRIAGASGYVQVMQNEPVRLNVSQGDWRNVAVNWYENPTDLTTPLVWDQGQQGLKQFKLVSPDEVTNPPVTPTKTSGVVSNVQLTDDTLSFDTTAIGVPHWIKISYFPNWHVTGAEGPYLASPSFMMVIPTQSHVTLYYGRTNANNLGQILEVIGWLVLVGIGTWRVIVWRRRRRMPEGNKGEQPNTLDPSRGSLGGEDMTTSINLAKAKPGDPSEGLGN